MSTTAVGPVVFAIKVNDVPSKLVPLDFEVRQAWGSHELLIMRLVVPKGLSYTRQLQAWPDDAAVEIDWGRYPTSVDTFYGYINHHEIATSDDMTGQNVQITYVMIGTSAKMNGDKSRTWKGCTITAMGQRIAREHSLRCVVTSTKWVLPYEVQAAESDFQFLCRMADKVGFRFWVSGGTLYLINPIVLLSGASNFFIPQYGINKQPYSQDSAQNFKLLQGSAIPGAFRMARTVYGVNENTGKFIQATADGGSPDDDQIVNVSRNVASAQEAKQIVNASQALSQFWLTGTVEVFGHTRLYPGKMISLAGLAMPDNTEGNWIVASARHVMRLSGNANPVNDHYVSQLTIVSNSKATLPFIKGVHKITPEFIDCVLRSGTWQAQTLNTIVEGVFG